MERPFKCRRVNSAEDSSSSLEPDLDSTSVTPSSLDSVERAIPSMTCPMPSRIKSKGSKSGATKSPERRCHHPTTVAESITASIESGEQDTFASLGVDTWLVNSLSHVAIEWPTRIQKACIPQILTGRDCIGGSRTGSGKTVAFAVPILQAWARDPSGIFAVVMTPTRELALQIYEQISALGARHSVRCTLVTGGGDMRQQALDLSRRPHIVVATPGRLADHISNSGEDTVCGLRRVKYVVLDEADRLLATGKGSMLDDLETCLDIFPPAETRQTCLFTATVTPEVRAIKDAPCPPDRPKTFICEVDIDDLAGELGWSLRKWICWLIGLPRYSAKDSGTDIPARQCRPQREVLARPPTHSCKCEQNNHGVLQSNIYSDVVGVHAAPS